MATPRFFLRVGSWYKSFSGKALSSDLEITSVVNDSDPNDPFIEDDDSDGGPGLPSQTGNSGKFLKTDGSAASWDDVPSGGGTVTNITYAALVTAIGASGLTAGQQYKITDYATKHYIVDAAYTQYLDTIITGVNEALIVTATSANTIDKEAKSILHPEDIIYYDWNPANWINDLSFADYTGAPVIVTGFKGVIYFRHDTLLDNYTGYDFRNVKFRRWKTDPAEGVAARALLDMTLTEYWMFSAAQTTGGITANPLEFDDFKTFAEGSGTATYEMCCRANHFEPFKDNNVDADLMRTILNNNVLFLQDDNYYVFYNNQFAAESYANTMAGYNESNIIGPNFAKNLVGRNFNYNRIGSSFQDNIVAQGFQKNTTERGFAANILCENCQQNTFDYQLSAINFIGASHVTEEYSCHLSKRVDGTAKLTYINNSDALTVVNANA